MSTETKSNLAERFRQNWQLQYPYSGGNDSRTYQTNILKHNNTGTIENTLDTVSNNMAIIDDSLTNLNWLQNLNLFSMPHDDAPLSPLPVTYYHGQRNTAIQSGSTNSNVSKLAHPFFETNSLYAEVAQNLEFINEEASTHFFKVNNQLRPPFSDINLISMAIYSYNKSKVSLPEICHWIEETFPYYKIINQDWKIGVKNNLTLSKCFQKVPKRKEDAEKGGFWRFSNEFLGYLEKHKMMKRNLNEIVINFQQENNNQTEYRFGKLIQRKRKISPTGPDVENINSAFKIPIKRPNLCDNQLFVGLGDFDQLVQRSFVGETTNSFILRSEEAMYRFCSPIQSSNPMSTNSNNVTIIPTVTSTSNIPDNPKLEQQIFQTNFVNVPTPTVVPSPEQVTEEEFLSGRVYNNNYLSTQSNLENLPTLLDSQVRFSDSDFNIHDLSITGIGIRPPEWWNQSFSASQISISKLSCSLRSLTSVGNVDRGSPFTEEDHHPNWRNDPNLEELDILFGLS